MARDACESRRFGSTGLRRDRGKRWMHIRCTSVEYIRVMRVKRMKFPSRVRNTKSGGAESASAVSSGSELHRAASRCRVVGSIFCSLRGSSSNIFPPAVVVAGRGGETWVSDQAPSAQGSIFVRLAASSIVLRTGDRWILKLGMYATRTAGVSEQRGARTLVRVRGASCRLRRFVTCGGTTSRPALREY